jgi:hypothetical protein
MRELYLHSNALTGPIPTSKFYQAVHLKRSNDALTSSFIQLWDFSQNFPGLVCKATSSMDRSPVSWRTAPALRILISIPMPLWVKFRQVSYVEVFTCFPPMMR